jgi:lipoate-protein ligase A
MTPAGNQLVPEPYDLADSFLLNPSSGTQCLVWQPERTMVVIGKGSDIETEVNVTSVEWDKVPVVRRATGGCAVVLSPQMAVASFVIHSEKQLGSREYFRHFNALIIDALAKQGITGLEYRGTSDIAIGERKVAGTAIYRNRAFVFFHAVINISSDTDTMERYLRIPPRMPDYRRSRSHVEFVSSIETEGFRVDLDKFAADLKRDFEAAAPEFIAAAGTEAQS